MRKLFLLLALSLTSINAFAETPEEKGLAIAVEADRRDLGFGDFTADMLMILKNKQGEESTRVVRVQNLEVKDDGDKSLSIFDEPADVKGTTMLTYSHKVEDDDQWMYLPALKRVKRIASDNKSGSYMGSEFAYEDIGSQEVEKYTYKYLRDEVIEGQPCFVVERYPVNKNSGYKRQVTWIDKAEYRPWKIDFYDRKDSLLKTLTIKGYKQYLKKHWRPDEMFMVNHQTGKSTLLKWSNYKFHAGLTDADFTQESLKRAR
ncbi:MAG: outer membrane lipoprotein-sorting protein [Gammaproteobacteria bacterium]|nr:outer membrane lipoprotein-sorting protein [Gammaproteobacteria bacterium]